MVDNSFIPVCKQFVITDFYCKMFNRVLPSDFIFKGEKHNFWEVEFVLDGEIELTEDENIYILKSNDIIFHAPMEFHSLNNKRTVHLINLSFKASGSLPENITNGFFHLSENEKEEFLSIFHRAHDFVKSKPTVNILAQETSNDLESFIISVCENHHSKNKISTSNASLTYKTLVELMTHNVLENITIEDLANRSFVSVSYIKSLFYRYAKTSPKSYYNSLRISVAQNMLSQGLSVNEISEKMNFSSPNYFSLFFKNHTGMTPLQYKKTLN